MDRFSKKLEKIICHFIVVMAIVMIALGILQVFTRYVLQNSMVWTEEAMRYIHVWITMIGAVVGFKRGYFVVIGFFYDFMKKKSMFIGKIVGGIQAILPILFFITLGYYGLIFALKNLQQSSATINISMGIVYLAIPLCGFLGLGISLSTAIDFFRTIFVKEVK